MGHNTLRRHLYLLGLLDSPLCRKCGVGEENSAHNLCECEALASLRHVYLGSFFLEQEDIRSLGLGAIWNCSKFAGLPRGIRFERPRTQMQIYLSITVYNLELSQQLISIKYSQASSHVRWLNG